MTKSPLAAAGTGKKKMLKRFLAAVLLTASVERFFVSRMRDFLVYKIVGPEQYANVL